MGKRSHRNRHLRPVMGGGGGAVDVVPAPSRGSPDAGAVIDAVASGVLDDDLDRIAAVISARLAALAHARGVALAARLEVGDRVRVNASARPLYLQGCCGTVVGRAGDRIVVKLDQPVGRFVTGEVRCPAAVLDVLASGR